MTNDAHRDAADDALVAHLGDLAAGRDDVPDAVRASAREAYSWRNLDEELAVLVHDSSLDDEAMAGVRGSDVRYLTFEGGGLTVEVAVRAARRREVIGQLVPSQAAAVEVRHRAGAVRVETDGLGHFGPVTVPAGPMSIRCHVGAAAPVDTDWVTV
jgi:hypothetical protein